MRARMSRISAYARLPSMSADCLVERGQVDLLATKTVSWANVKGLDHFEIIASELQRLVLGNSLRGRFRVAFELPRVMEHRGRSVSQKSLWTIFHRAFEVLGVMEHRPMPHSNIGSLWDEMTRNVHTSFRNRSERTDRNRWIISHCLIQAGKHIR